MLSRRERAWPHRSDQAREGRSQRRSGFASRAKSARQDSGAGASRTASTLFDSRVIVEYLDHRAGGGKIIPQEPKARFAALRLQALADGMTDAQILLVYEGRFRPPEHHVKKWTDYQADKIKRGFDALEADPPSLDADPECRPDRARLLPRPPRSSLRRRLARRASQARGLARPLRRARCRPSPRPRWRRRRISPFARGRVNTAPLPMPEPPRHDCRPMARGRRAGHHPDHRLGHHLLFAGADRAADRRRDRLVAVLRAWAASRSACWSPAWSRRSSAARSTATAAMW